MVQTVSLIVLRTSTVRSNSALVTDACAAALRAFFSASSRTLGRMGRPCYPRRDK
jgi:hypothetical protein